jgi:hypothetical protein
VNAYKKSLLATLAICYLREWVNFCRVYDGCKEWRIEKGKSGKKIEYSMGNLFEYTSAFWYIPSSA